ncbi:hypothetical protein L7F22_035052 [Adiantum nelumboides]|nr:hypothetical protein [Adiantum nelumboides]
MVNICPYKAMFHFRFVTGVIPPGNDDLRGDEPDTILMFRNALGLEDPDAAAVHIEIGRRIFRQRLETGDKDTAVQERRAFQKLVYVSNLVFGDASKFLLPWKRVFQLTDSQVEIAMRDNAQRLFQAQLKSLGADLDLDKFVALRKLQLKLKLSDECQKVNVTFSNFDVPLVYIPLVGAGL